MTDLKEFISQTIKQVVEGSRDTGLYLKDNISYDNEGYVQIGDGSMHKVEFDISVTTTESTTKEGKAGIMVKVVDFGVKGSDNVGASSSNRFSIPISFPKMANKNV